MVGRPDDAVKLDRGLACATPRRVAAWRGWERPLNIARAEIELHGRRFHYRKAGKGSLVVLLHGIAGSSATWSN